jgi:hypothetical protein
MAKFLVYLILTSLEFKVMLWKHISVIIKILFLAMLVQ